MTSSIPLIFNDDDVLSCFLAIVLYEQKYQSEPHISTCTCLQV